MNEFEKDLADLIEHYRALGLSPEDIEASLMDAASELIEDDDD